MTTIRTLQQEAVLKELFSVQDLKYKEFHRKLVPTVDPDSITGVHIPALRKIAKMISNKKNPFPLHSDFLPYRAPSDHPYYEEILLEGLSIAYTKCEFSDYLALIHSFVPKINNWAVCDTFCGTLKPVQLHLPETWTFLCENYLKVTNSTAKEYELRFAVVMLLGYYIREDYIDQVLHKMNEIDHPAYYVKMAVAWALSYCFIKFPEKTIAYFRSPENHLDLFTYHKSIQKACESFRISSETKELLRRISKNSKYSNTI